MNDPQNMFALATLLGAVGIFLMLPRGTGRGWFAGAVLAVAALGLGASQLPPLGDYVANGLFLTLAGVTVVSALATITLRNPLYCAIWFGMSLLGTAGLFLLGGAQFLAVATVVVYAGAILVTFLFVLMLAQPRGEATYDRVSWEALVSSAAGMVMVGILSMNLSYVFSQPVEGEDGPMAAAAAASPEELTQRVLADQHVAHIGGELFGRHLIAVEVAGILLLVALIGAAVICAKPTTNQQE